jgi:rhamnogalacturonan hydrolase
MIAINGGSDFELYSSTSKGAIQGYGYVFHTGMIFAREQQ